MRDLKIYMFQAFKDWAIDNGMTPYLLVKCGAPGVQLPKHIQDEYKDTELPLNIGPKAAESLNFDLEDGVVAFLTRFKGVPATVVVPLEAIVAVQVEEIGATLGCDLDSSAFAKGLEPKGPQGKKPGQPNHLKVIK